MEEAIVKTPGVMEHLSQALPYGILTILMATTFFGFFKWVMRHLSRLDENRTKREDKILDIVANASASRQSNADAIREMGRAISDLKDYCHQKIDRERDDSG